MKTTTRFLVSIAGLALAACSSSPTDPPEDPGASLPTEPDGTGGDTRDLDPGSGDGFNEMLLGGQSGNEGAVSIPPCLRSTQTAVRATVVTADDHCIALRVDELLANPALSSVQVGDTLGGSLRPLSQSTSLSNGNSVFAMWSPPVVDQCRQYRDCSLETCGAQPEEGTERELAEWDACDTQCLTSTQGACDEQREAALASESYALAGTVQLGSLDAEGNVAVDWKGLTHSVAPEQFLAATCEDFFFSLPEAEPSGNNAAETAGEAPPPGEPVECPLAAGAE